MKILSFVIEGIPLSAVVFGVSPAIMVDQFLSAKCGSDFESKQTHSHHHKLASQKLAVTFFVI